MSSLTEDQIMSGEENKEELDEEETAGQRDQAGPIPLARTQSAQVETGKSHRDAAQAKEKLEKKFEFKNHRNRQNRE